MDQRVDLPETDYFFLGDGRLLSAIQWSRATEATPLGLLLGRPERAVRKIAALTMHPELGLRRTLLTIVIDGQRYHADHASTTVEWTASGSVVARWAAGHASVRELFACGGHGTLHRIVEVVAPDASSVLVEAALYANPLFCTGFTALDGRLEARGDVTLSLDSVPAGQAFERFLTIEPTRDRGTWRAVVRYALDQEELAPIDLGLLASSEVEPDEPGVPPSVLAADDEHAAVLERGRRIERQLTLSRRGLRAVVGHGGRFPASVWQYEFEWGMDASMLATAASLCGQHELAHEVLLNVLTRLSTADGAVAEAGRFRDGELAELNGNGSVLDAVWHHWRCSGDESLVRERWDRIVAIAEYPLTREVRLEPGKDGADGREDGAGWRDDAGLLRGRRDFWERLPWHGVDDGFELAHQVFCAVGLERAASIAAALGEPARAERWAAASRRLSLGIRRPGLGFVDGERIWHRRRMNGTLQHTMQADSAWDAGVYAPYAPMHRDGPPRPRRCDPDVTSVLPIVYGLIEPQGSVATSTVEALEALWSPTGHGGYARYPLESDPDSPGPWPFATAFAAAAQIEAGFGERARRSIDWLLDAAGAGGSWLEYYGDRTPPAPPVGVIPWGWAQFIILTIRHLAGVQLADDHVRIRPRLAALHLPVHLGRHRIDLAVEGLGPARLDGQPFGRDGDVVLPLPLRRDHTLLFEAP